MTDLQVLGVILHKFLPKSMSRYLFSQEDKLADRMEKFGYCEELFNSLGIYLCTKS